MVGKRIIPDLNRVNFFYATNSSPKKVLTKSKMEKLVEKLKNFDNVFC